MLSYFNKDPARSEFEKFSYQGNIKGIQQLLTKGLMSPESIPPSQRWLPLTYALSHGYLEVCELLLAAGADANTLEPISQM